MLNIYNYHTNPEELTGWAGQLFPSTDEMLEMLEDQMYAGDYFDVDYDIAPLGRKAIAISLTLDGVKIWGKLGYNENTGVITAVLEYNDASVQVNDERFKDVHDAVKSICQSFSDIAHAWAEAGG
jgi:hypothetical protein